MKFQFNPRKYQEKAINSVIKLFEGEPTVLQKFDQAKSNQPINFYGNQLKQLVPEILLENLQKVQQENNRDDAPITISKELNDLDYSIEMETGTGKTLVYFRTIAELANTYGWNKFVIIVPSVAIREGVSTEFERLKSELEKISKKPVFLTTYTSGNLNNLRTYYNSSNVEILLMTMQSFNSSNNILNREHYDLEVEKPINWIQDVRPIIILDEPQKMGGEATTNKLKAFNALFTLRYSATHKELVNPIFRYTPIDAYEDRYVKKIEVLSVYGNDIVDIPSYVEVVKIDNDATGLYAQLKFYQNSKAGTKIISRKSRHGKDLYQESNEMPEYKGYKINEINLKDKFVKFDNGVKLKESEVSQNKDEIMRVQIYETIQAHLDKEIELNIKGIKVLSLFFIDKVINYRDEEDEFGKGKIRKWFEEAYQDITAKDKYKEFAVGNIPYIDSVDEIQGAYFAQDKKGYRDTSGNTKTYDYPMYDLIMKNKEKLLSFNNPVRFIFSHSALREGWDNPNVFQICTLNEVISETRKRQEIGRGLRLPVNQQGERIQDESINILTVAANESYEAFARGLQNEIEDETGIRTTKSLPENARTKKKIYLKKEALNHPEFQKLWNKINKKTIYDIEMNDNEVVDSIVFSILESGFTIDEPTIRIQRTEMQQIQDAGEFGAINEIKNYDSTHERRIPNVIKRISDYTGLTKRNVVEIIKKADIGKQIFVQPDRFVEKLTDIINYQMPSLLLEGIKYVKTDEEYELSLFKDEIEIYEDSNLLSPMLFDHQSDLRTIYEVVQLDSKNEVKLIRNFKNNPAEFKFYLKLPNWFTIDTPAGTYNPDWAVVYEEYGNDKLYLVRESKKTEGKNFTQEELRSNEVLKIQYGKKHFDEINVNYQVIETTDDIKNGVFTFGNESFELERHHYLEKLKQLKEFNVDYEVVKKTNIEEFEKYQITLEDFDSL